MVDVKTEVVKALRNNSELMSALGNKDEKYKRIYQIKTPYAEEFPRVIVYLISSNDRDYYDNKRMSYNAVIQVSLFMKEDNTFEIMKIIDDTLINLGYIRIDECDIYEEETNCFHKANRYKIKKLY